MHLGLGLLECVRSAYGAVAERRGGTDVTIVKELHLRRVVHEVASRIVLVVRQAWIILRIHCVSEQQLVELVLPWHWNDLVVHSGEHL